MLRLFGNVTETLREICVTIRTHFRNVANDYPETKREFSGVNPCLNPSAFKQILPNGKQVNRDNRLAYSTAKTLHLILFFPCLFFFSSDSDKGEQVGCSYFKFYTYML